MSNNKYTEEDELFLLEQCEILSKDFERLKSNMVNMINSIEDEDARENFMNLYNNAVNEGKPKKYPEAAESVPLKTTPRRIKK